MYFKKLSIILPVLLLTHLTHAQTSPIQYPATEKVDQTDDYFGVKISDPYRWLEHDTAANVGQWVNAQNQVTQKYLANIPFRDAVKKRLEQIWNYPKYSAPFKEGEYYFFYKNDGLQNQSVLYYQKGLNAEPEVFLDPNTLSADGTVALSGITFSKNHKYAAYTVSESGSDWQQIYVMEVATKKLLSDQVKWVKFSNASWRGNGFYYSRYDAPAKGKEFSTQNQYQKVYYHTLGTSQEKDELVFEDKEHPLRYFFAQVTDDERYVIVYASEGTHGTELYAKDMDTNSQGFQLICKGFENNYSVIDNVGNKLLVHTDYGAPNYRLVSIDPRQTHSSSWKTIIPEKPELLEGVNSAGGKLFASYLKDASSKVYQLSIDGKTENEIKLPAIGSAGGFSGEKTDKELFYTFTSFTYPTTIYRYTIATGKSEIFRKSEVKFSIDDYVTKQIFYTSKDGTKVPMFIVHKKGLVMDGNNPTYLYAYGGFNISLTPSFSAKMMVFLENGGIYAMPNLRGGGEYGENWHKGGMLEKKQNVFDDFIGAAEYLIKEKYTSSQKLAIAGGSNGGLLVGAVMTQRPELFKVALPAVGVMDMLRYHKFTIGWGWAVEYGSSDKQEQFNYLIKYSPLHNLKEGINYPATLVTTADHDDRVVPAHSFKFAATLQEKHKGNNPVLIRIESKAGHGAGKPTSKQIEEAADIWSFVWYTMGVTPNLQKNQ
ncbi:prolyl oligopeptidase family serine peptidase [Rhodocytophaga aerolata]|uniref:prolyl oligopeptidase n=1 Tax=Rhodocytophaga aerolata TaxID=455078 RepID=A0ABT8R1L2_9BACT|nr:prolyl oligopeptidase family serine peptidase [Rhodocytophaga aerolata]MDO1445986.1 prolyl oligopeptidase family serine peptidase [Rhodocytophaga aerolata]